jgi:anti-sigma-K factor RskA
MSSVHDEQALAAAYVLGALDADERRAFEAHLATCVVCGEEVRSLSGVVNELAFSAPPRTPRPELRERVLSSLTARPQAVRSAEERPSRTPAWLWWPLAASLVLTAGLAAYSWQLQQRVAVLEARLDDAERRAGVSERAMRDAQRTADQAQTAMAVLAAPDMVRIDLAGLPPARQATGRALWSRNRGLVFTATNLPVVPPDRTYQVWVVTANAAVSAGLLTPDTSGRATEFFTTPPDIAPPVAVAVTVEPAGGVPAPTGQKYLIGTPP